MAKLINIFSMSSWNHRHREYRNNCFRRRQHCRWGFHYKIDELNRLSPHQLPHGLLWSIWHNAEALGSYLLAFPIMISHRLQILYAGIERRPSRNSSKNAWLLSSIAYFRCSSSTTRRSASAYHRRRQAGRWQLYQPDRHASRMLLMRPSNGASRGVVGLTLSYDESWYQLHFIACFVILITIFKLPFDCVYF